MYIPSDMPARTWWRARDMFISLPGLTITNGEFDKFEAVMATAERGIREFMEGEPLSVQIYEINQPDVLLWAVWCIQQYAKLTDMETVYKKYGRLVCDIHCIAGICFGLVRYIADPLGERGQCMQEKRETGAWDG